MQNVENIAERLLPYCLFL